MLQLPEVEPNLLSNLPSRLRDFDTIDLLTTAAALQLDAANADMLICIEAFAHAIAACPANQGEPKATLHELRKFLDTPPIADSTIRSLVDPCDNLFTESFTISEGTFIVFPGIAAEPAFVLQHIANALSSLALDPRTQDFARTARQWLVAVFVLSDAVARRAGLNYGLEPSEHPLSEIHIPETAILERYKQAVIFSDAELRELLESSGLSINDLEPFTLELGQVDATTFDVTNGDLFKRPLVRTGAQLIVAIPSALLWVARHQILCAAQQQNLIERLGLTFHDSIGETLSQILPMLAFEPINIELPSSQSIRYVSDACYTFDTDKIAYVVFITDDFDDYNSEGPFSDWHLDEKIGLDERLAQVETYLYEQKVFPINNILILLVHQSVGRPVAFSISKPNQARTLMLGLTAADLKVFSMYHGSAADPLELWKYAKAKEIVSNRMALIQCWDFLTEYEFYVKNKCSYYVSDQQVFNAIWIAPGGGGILFREVYRKRKWHGVQMYNADGFIEVTAVMDGKIPIYASIEDIKDRQEIAFTVESGPIPIWVISDGKRGSGSLSEIVPVLTDTVAYWLWQVSTSLMPFLKILANHLTHLEVHIVAQSFQSQQVENPDATSLHSMVMCRAEPEGGKLELSIEKQFEATLTTSNNSGERHLLSAILFGFRELLPASEQVKFDGDHIAEIIEDCAPLGLKRKSILFKHAMPALDSRGLVSFRAVHEADTTVVLDELGEHLIETKKFKIGTVAPDKKSTVIKAAVAFLYQQLEAQFAVLNADGLVEWLIRQHETTIHHETYDKFTIPTRRACFSNDPEMIKRIENELSKAVTVSIVGRFLIEYAAAQPPKGTTPISLDVYDRLLALGNLIVNFGFEDDNLHYQITDPQVSLLPSKRLRVIDSRYQKAYHGFIQRHHAEEIEKATPAHLRLWRTPKTAEESRFPDQDLSNAFGLAFGISLEDTLEFIIETVVVAADLDPGVAVLPLEEFECRLTAQLGWTTDKVQKALHLLSLTPRASFLFSGKNAENHEVYPWRFNRSLSYLRRPLIQYVQQDVTYILWGRRHLIVAGDNLLQMCRTSRLKTDNTSLRSILGQYNRQRGQGFNDDVAQKLRALPHLQVRTGVKKISFATKSGATTKLTLTENGQDLGDIDVLVVDPVRRCIWSLECKNLAFARTPYEVGHEIEVLFEGTIQEPSYAERHRRRNLWIRKHLAEVLEWLGIAGKAKRWQAKAAIVVDEEMLSPRVKRSKMQVLTVEQFIIQKLT
jgi:hypothetical protein